MDELYGSRPFTRFYTINFESKKKQSVNPYDIKTGIKLITGAYPKRISSEQRDSYTIEVVSKEQGDKLLLLREIANEKCEVKKHLFYNYSKGIVYIEEYDVSEESLGEFEAGFKEEDLQIEKVELAKFIKPKNKNTTPLLITFDNETPPNHVYIPGERADNKVYPYQVRPMRCNRCLEYGHTVKRCKNNIIVCKLCAGTDHEDKACNEQALKCHHCKGEHQAGDKSCTKQQEEQEIVDIQQKHKVSRLRARQMLRKTTEITKTQEVNKCNKFFKCEMDANLKRKLTPWVIDKCITHALTGKVKITTGAKDYLIIEVETAQQSIEIMKIKDINKIPVVMSEYQEFNTSQGIVYIYGYDLSNFEAFKKGIKEDLTVADAELAFWVKPRVSFAKAVKITFKQKTPPEFIEIPGEQTLSRVYEVLPRPMRCVKCQDYGHTKKNCKNDNEICGKCNIEGHSLNKCLTLNRAVCHNCTGDHIAGDRKCPVYKKEMEILIIQTKEKVTKAQAMVILGQRNGDTKSDYAGATKKGQTNLEEKKTNKSNSEQTKRKVRRPPDKSNNNMPLTDINELTVELKNVSDKRRREPSDDEILPTTDIPTKKKITEAVLQSPASGRLYTARVELDRTVDTNYSDEESLTSETNPHVRLQAEKFFNKLTKELKKENIPICQTTSAHENEQGSEENTEQQMDTIQEYSKTDHAPSVSANKQCGIKHNIRKEPTKQF